jgi:GNAT superfamily N-acetyltransferase
MSAVHDSSLHAAGLEIVVPEVPIPEHRAAIGALLEGFNDISPAGPDPVTPFAVLVREPDSDAIIGGLWGTSYWRWLFVELLFVPETRRGQGLGSRLLAEAEAAARRRRCIGVWLMSWSFQAPAFYRSRGYMSVGEIEDFPPGQQCFYFVKRL